MPVRLRAAAFCARGTDAAYGPGEATSWARGLQGGAARAEKLGGGGRDCRVRRQGDGARGRCGSAQAGQGGGEGEAEHTLPHASPRSPGLGGEDAGLRRAPRGDTLAPARSPVRPGAAAPTADPGLAAASHSLPGGAARPRPGPAVIPTPGPPGEPGEEAPAGPTLRKAWVTWGVAGGWAAFRAGGGRQVEEEEGGRSRRGAEAVGQGPGK